MIVCDLAAREKRAPILIGCLVVLTKNETGGCHVTANSAFARLFLTAYMLAWSIPASVCVCQNCEKLERFCLPRF